MALNFIQKYKLYHIDIIKQMGIMQINSYEYLSDVE